MKTHRLIFVFLLFGSFSYLFSQSIRAKNIEYAKDVEVIFSQGISEYRLGQYQQALDIFQNIITKYPENQRITIVKLMLGKSHYKIGNYEQALSIFQKLNAEYLNSNYIDDSRFMIAHCYYQMEKYVASTREFLWVSDYGKDKRLIEKSRNLVLKIIENNLTIDEITNLKFETIGNTSSAILTIKLAQKWDLRGNKDKAISLLEDFINLNPNNEYLNILKEVLKSIQSDKKLVTLKIGVILPLSSEFSDQAHGVLNGIKYALQKFNEHSGLNISLIVKDSEGSIINCLNSTKELAKDNRVVAIIGELESEKTASIASIIDHGQVPLIVPVASDNGIAALSSYVFQVNGDLQGRGAFLAKFAMEVLKDSTFATFAPADHYGKEMTDSFTATVDALNGEIVAQKWYYENTQELGKQFESIRKLGFSRMNKDSLIYSYTKDMTPFQRAKFKEEVIPVTSIDAVFFPIYTEDIKYVVPQFAFANIRAHILGGQYWYNIDELRNKNIIAHVDSLCFESDYFIDEFDPQFRNLRNDFRKIMGKTPEIMEFYGYDAMQILINAIMNNAVTRDDIRNYLDNLEGFKGLRGLISFNNNNRVNSEHRIISFRNGRFILLR